MTSEIARNIESTELDWLNKQHGQILPYRGEFSDFNNDFQFLLERDDDGMVRMRHVGLFIEALFGAALAGRSFQSLYADTNRVLLNKELSTVFEEPAKIYIHALAPTKEIQFGLFPISEDYGPVNYALGACNLAEMPQTVVTNLGVRSIEKISLRQSQKSLRYGFAEDRAGFSGAPSRSRFRLITGGGRSEAQARPGLQIIHNVKREP